MVPFLHFWRLTIPTFGLMVAIAMLAAFYVLRADLARRDIAQRTSGTLHCDPANGHVLDNPAATALWRREYENGWEPVV